MSIRNTACTVSRRRTEFLKQRKKTYVVRVGNLCIGGKSTVPVQSMTKTSTRNVAATVRQIKEVEKIGCELIRCAVPDYESAQAIGQIKKRVSIPVVADIHFDYRLALESIRQGVDKIRINPGNIGDKERVKQVITAAKERGIAVRIGVNAGSLPRKYTDKIVSTGFNTDNQYIAHAMVSTAVSYCRMVEDWNFTNLVVSLKATDVSTTVLAYRLMSEKTRYPLHLGITESGFGLSGIVKSTLGLGLLLSEGIGDTIRVSLTSDPKDEIKTGYEILRALGLRRYGIEIISCPTCARCEVDLTGIVKDLETKLTGIAVSRPVKLAVMGCIVNGPGEARMADIGIAGGKNTGLLFRQGKPVRKVPPDQWVTTLITELKQI